MRAVFDINDSDISGTQSTQEHPGDSSNTASEEEEDPNAFTFEDTDGNKVTIHNFGMYL